MTNFITRFAPSPSGYLHLGHAYSALCTYQAAQSAGGQFLLRIEDIDLERCKPEFEHAILEDLQWLGINWDALPIRQSEHFPAYTERLEKLMARGLVYRCFRTRKDIDEAIRAPHHAPQNPFTAEALPVVQETELLNEGTLFAYRLSMATAKAALGNSFTALHFIEETNGKVASVQAHAEQFGDVVLGRKDNGTSYHIASIHDDIKTGVTHIIRGEDLRKVAGLHALLYALFEEKPPIYRHHKLILSADGKRLAKRDKAATLRSLRDAGKTRDDIFSMLGIAQLS